MRIYLLVGYGRLYLIEECKYMNELLATMVYFSGKISQKACFNHMNSCYTVLQLHETRFLFQNETRILEIFICDDNYPLLLTYFRLQR